MAVKENIAESPLVFVVDADASAASSTSGLIRSVGIRAEAFFSGEDLLNSGRVTEASCLILDLRMPNMDGWEVLRRLKQAGPVVPVIFFSAHASQEDENRALRSGVVAFLRKPVCSEALLREIHRALAMQVAVAREREMLVRQRAADLAKANEALRNCLDALASVPELDQFVGKVMAVITGQLGAASGALGLFNPETRHMEVELIFQDGQVLPPVEAGYPDSGMVTLQDDRVSAVLNKPITVIHLSEPEASIITREVRDYLDRLGVETLLIVRLISRGVTNGVLSFRFTEKRNFAAEELEIARALAIQAGLAIQLTQLAKTAKRSAVLEERNRLAGEIHDSLAQSFAGICMHLAVAAEGTPENAKDTLTQIERVIGLASFGLSEARRSAMSLRSDLIEELGLIEALKTLVKRSNIPGRLHCTFRSNFANDERVPVAFRQDLLRIAQEAISNAIRHAKSTTISVSLRVDPSGLVLKVKDNGCGMIRRPEIKDGFGFVNMRARVKKLNGCLDVRTAPGRGTSIMVTLPLDR